MIVFAQKEIDKILNTKKEFGVHTGITKLDDFIYGFRPGNLIIEGGCSSMGKTSLMTDHIIAAAHDVSVGVFSIEMGIAQIVDRMVFNISGLNYHRCQKNTSKNEKELLAKARKDLKDLKPIYFADNVDCLYPEWKLEKSKPKDSIEIAMQEMYEAGVRIFFIDYLQLVRWGYTTESETLRLKNITNSFHSLALKYNVPIILLSQLTKATADRATRKEDPTPTLSDLRDSGYIINDADIIILIHRPEYYKKKKEELNLLEDCNEEAQLIIGKQRNGPTGVIEITFRSYCMSFSTRNSDELF